MSFKKKYFSEKFRTLSRVQNGTVQLGTVFFKLELTYRFSVQIKPSKRKVKKLITRCFINFTYSSKRNLLINLRLHDKISLAAKSKTRNYVFQNFQKASEILNFLAFQGDRYFLILEFYLNSRDKNDYLETF